MDLDTLSLDELFKQARRAQHAAADAAAKRTQVREKKPASSGVALYTDIANYTRGADLGIIHKETQTLLGVFTEYIHRADPSIRRLIRQPEPVAQYRVEYVSGAGWVDEPAPRAASARLPTHTLTLHVELDQLRAEGTVMLTVTFQGEGILRVDLFQDSTFGDAQGNLLTLPAGTNILPILTQNSKINLREELKWQLR